nr:hypothetical protein [Iningainema tapete]
MQLAGQDVRRLLEKQKDERQILLTQLNILFVTNSALLTVLTISKLLPVFSLFSVAEILLFLLNFTLLINAFLPRQLAVSPNLKDDQLDVYLRMQPIQYQLQTLSDLSITYNTNKQRLDEISQLLLYAAYVTWGIAFVALLHFAGINFLPQLQKL